MIASDGSGIVRDCIVSQTWSQYYLMIDSRSDLICDDIIRRAVSRLRVEVCIISNNTHFRKRRYVLVYTLHPFPFSSINTTLPPRTLVLVLPVSPVYQSAAIGLDWCVLNRIGIASLIRVRQPSSLQSITPPPRARRTRVLFHSSQI